MLTVFAKVSDYDDEIKDYCDQVNYGSLWKEAMRLWTFYLANGEGVSADLLTIRAASIESRECIVQNRPRIKTIL